jgi:hypothetical protein
VQRAHTWLLVCKRIRQRLPRDIQLLVVRYIASVEKTFLTPLVK